MSRPRAAAPRMKGGLDLGGTKIQAVVTDGEANVLGTARRETPHGGPEKVMLELAETMRAALDDAGVELMGLAGVGVGAPGSIDADSGTVLQVPNIDGWHAPYPLGPALQEELGRPVGIGNDVNVAVEAERRFGAGRGFDSFLGVFWGTGVGGGIVVDGKHLVGRGSAGEIGHVCSKPGGRRCNCGLEGCVEAYAGRAHLEERAQEAAKERKTILFELMEKKGRTRLSSGVFASALEKGDKLAKELVDEAVWALSIALASVQNLLALEAIVIGGGLGDRLGEPFVRRIDDAMQPLLFVPDAAPTLLNSTFGDLSGAVGAAVMVGG